MKKADAIDIIFDGKCLMCNGFIRYIDSSAKNSTVRINAYSSVHIYNKYNNLDAKNYIYLEQNASRTIIVIKQSGETLLKSRAIEEIFISCNSMDLKILANLMKVLPYIIKDFAYELIAKVRRRIKLFNRNECYVQPLKSINMYNQ